MVVPGQKVPPPAKVKEAGFVFTVIVISSVEAVQLPLLIVHLKVYTPGADRLPIFVVGEPGVKIMAVPGPPGNCDQEPVPVTGALAAMVNVPGLTHAVPSGPALAVVGKGSTVTVVPADGADVQPPLVTVTV